MAYFSGKEKKDIKINPKVIRVTTLTTGTGGQNQSVEGQRQQHHLVDAGWESKIKMIILQTQELMDHDCVDFGQHQKIGSLCPFC